MITTHSARIEVDTGHGSDKAWADVSSLCSGYVAKVEFNPSFGGGFFLAHRKEDPRYRALIIAPADKWEGDIVGAGWVIDQKIESRT